MNAADIQALLGEQGVLTVHAGSDSMSIPVVIFDARSVYGRTDVRVEPQLGTGATWVRLDSVTLDNRSLASKLKPSPTDIGGEA